MPTKYGETPLRSLVSNNVNKIHTGSRPWYFDPPCALVISLHPRAYARGFRYLGINLLEE